MCILVSASTTLVFVAFSMVNFVLPFLPAIRPMQRDRCSPRSVCSKEGRPCFALPECMHQISSENAPHKCCLLGRSSCFGGNDALL